MDPKTTTDQASLRELNLSAVLRLIYDEAPLSRSQLAGRSGLNKSTISSLVEDLLERRLIHEVGINSAGKGRPAMLLEANPQAGAIVAVELGVDFVSTALVDFVGNILWRRLEGADPAASQEKTLAQARTMIDATTEVARERNLRILGLSFSIPGVVDLEQGELLFAPNLKWRKVPIRNIFSASTGLKVFIENDANAAAVGEHRFGVARNLHDFLFVFAGVGLGSGLFLNNQLYRGKRGFAGEIGHTPIIAEPYHNPCQCGNLGCWETYTNQLSILERVEARLDHASGSSVLRRMIGDGGTPLTLSIVTQAAEAGDQDALDSLAEAGSAMGTGFAVLVNIFNPEKIVLGGPISIAGEYLMPFIQESVNKHAMREVAPQAEINLSAFGPDASLIGAAAVVVDDILMSPSHVEKEVMLDKHFDAIAALT
jgi:glucokinase-like ROK family protein